jgi:DNA invertase Pin-like site-specific DNA recombinase
MQVISAVAEFERDLLLERTYSGIARAKAAGKRFGRPPILSEEQKQTVTERLNAGISISAAREFNTTRQTILRVKAGLLQVSGWEDYKKSNGYYEIKQPSGFFSPIFYKRVDKRGSRH